MRGKSTLLVSGLVLLGLSCWFVSLLLLLRSQEPPTSTVLASSSVGEAPLIAQAGVSPGEGGKEKAELVRHQDVPLEPQQGASRVSYIKLEGVDTAGNDLFLVHGASISRLKSICSGMDDCAGFNSDGWTKARITEKTRSSLDLYIKHVGILSVVPSVRSLFKDSAAGVFGDHMTEYSRMEAGLRIYVYETGVGRQYPSLKDYKYGVESTFIDLLAKSKFRTKLPSEATFFFLPSRCTAYRKSESQLQQGIEKAAEVMRDMLYLIKQNFPFWDQSLGTDHFYICAHDMGTEVVKLADLELWKNAIGLVNTAEYSERYFVPHKDISVPHHPGRGTVDWSIMGQGGVNSDPQRRTKLAFMAGHADRGPVRPLIYQYFGQDSDFDLVKGHLEEKAYLKALVSSKFCLCPRGNKGWSPRVMDALWFGCVPVFIADHYHPPLYGLIHWQDISISVPEKQVGSLKTILQNVSSQTLATMQENIAQVYHHLTWHDPPRPYDAFHAVLFQLWQRRHIRRTKPHPLPGVHT